jgi:hypothetical protein
LQNTFNDQCDEVKTPVMKARISSNKSSPLKKTEFFEELPIVTED